MMPAGDLIVEPFQYEYNGLLLGSSTEFHVVSVNGLIGYPALRSGTVPRFGNHGGVAGRHYLPHREFILKLDYVASDDSTFGEYRRQVMSAFQPRVTPDQVLPFCFWHPGDQGKMLIQARPVDFGGDVDRRFALGFPEVPIRFEAADPLHYSVQEFQTSVALTPDTTGLVFPLDFPLNFGAGVSNQVTLTNNGTAPATWSCTITGQVEGPRLEKVGSGEELNFPDLDIASGDTLVLSEANRTVLYNGTASRRGELTPFSKWFKLDPQTTTTIRYTNNGSSSGSVATFTWRYAYWGES